MPARYFRLLTLALFLQPLIQPAYAQRGLPDQADEAYEDTRLLLDAQLYSGAAQHFRSFREAYPNDPRSPEALFHEAEAMLAIGNDDLAADLFSAFYTRYPAHALANRARLALGEHYYAAGQYALAEDALLAGLNAEQPPESSAKTRYLLGLTTLQQSRYDVAISHFERAFSDYPGTESAPLALYATGQVQAEQGVWQGAARAFEQLTSDYPNHSAHANVGIGLAEAYAHLGNYQDAADELQQRLPQLSGDERIRGRWLMGDVLLRLGRAGEARPHFESMPGSGPFSRRAELGIARIDFENGNYDAAIDGFESVRNSSTESGSHDELAHEAAYYEGLALKEVGDLGEAEGRLEGAYVNRQNGGFADAALLELGILRFERRQHRAAADALSRLLSQYPRSPFAGQGARMLGEAYAALGDTERAREAHQRAQELGSASPELGEELQFMEAYGLFNDGRYARAEPALLAVFESNRDGPRAGEALFWAGESAFQAGQYGRAESHLRQFVQRFPRHRQSDAARYVLAWTHFKRRDYSAAARGFEQFLSAYSRSAESVPYFADALLRLGDSYYALRRFDDAIAVYNRVATATADGRGADYAMFQAAQAQTGAGRSAQAHTTLDRLLATYDQSALRAEARYAKGSLYFQEGDYPSAIVEYERVVREHRDSPIAAKALYGIGDAQYNEGRMGAAEAAYRRVLTDYPSSPFAANALDGLQYALDAQGRGDEFAQIVGSFERRTTDPATRDRLRIRQAELAYENGSFESAVSLLEQLLGQSSDPSIQQSAMLTLGSAYAGMGRFTDAADTFGRLASRFPDSPLASEAALRRGEALYQSGNYQASVSALQDYEADFPNDTERIRAALRTLAQAYDALGQTEERDEVQRRLQERYSTMPESEEGDEN